MVGPPPILILIFGALLIASVVSPIIILVKQSQYFSKVKHFKAILRPTILLLAFLVFTFSRQQYSIQPLLVLYVLFGIIMLFYVGYKIVKKHQGETVNALIAGAMMAIINSFALIIFGSIAYGPAPPQVWVLLPSLSTLFSADICAFSAFMTKIMFVSASGGQPKKEEPKKETKKEEKKEAKEEKPAQKEETSKRKGKFCSDCGAKILPDDAYCPGCGVKL